MAAPDKNAPAPDAPTAPEQKAAKSTRSKIEDYDIARSVDTLALATDLAKFIRENKLTHNVQGKEYVNVEGWQYAGSRLGIVPIVESVTDMSADGEIKYNSRVTLFDLRSLQTVGAGFALCSNKENGKKFYAEYAIASMAQTRAIGKAYRNILAYLIRAAGYEPTPAEEMDCQIIPATIQPQAQPEPANVAPESRQLGPGTPPSADPTAHLPGPPDAGSETPDNSGERYATVKQKEEIIRLCNNPVITRAEKTKMNLNINKLTEERAKESIRKLREAIEQREGEQRVAG